MADLIQVAHEIVDAHNARDFDRMKAFLTPDVVYDEVGTNRRMHGAGPWVECWEEWSTTMPGNRGKITDSIAAGMSVLLEVTWEGTPEAPLPAGTITAGEKRQSTRAAMVCTFEGDRVKECRHYFDSLYLFRRLGAIPS